MKILRRAVGRLSQKAVSGLVRRPFAFDREPMACFTFDDFPKSALDNAGRILRDHGAAGMYYTAMELCEADNLEGQHFSVEDLYRVLEEGHELGSHTYGHLSGTRTPAQAFLDDAAKGRMAVERIAGKPCGHFAYPFGDVRIGLKTPMGRQFSSCRGIFPGVNESPADLNLLRANRLYSCTFDMNHVAGLVERAKRSRGILIFYTHDVRENPSKFGCTAKEFEQVVSFIAKSGIGIRLVSEALKVA